MKCIAYFLVGLLLLFNSLSCKKDFLDVPNKTNLLRQQYVVDLNTTQHFLNGTYVELAMNFYYGMSVIYPDLIADNIKPRSGSSFIPFAYNWKQQADDTQPMKMLQDNMNANAIWMAAYRIIRDCSFILETVDKYRDQGPARTDEIKGQAYAIRALMHTTLINTFAQPFDFTAGGAHQGIPYITTSDWQQPVSRETVADVYKYLIDDLNNAVRFLPAGSANKNIMNQNAAKALLARVYLFKGDYNAAKSLARDVGEKVPIMKGAAYPNKLFTPEETEALFQLGPSSNNVAGGAGDYTTNFAGVYFAPPEYNFQFAATEEIADMLIENTADVRRKWVKKNGGNWQITKYPVNVIPGFSVPTASYYQTVLRSSEMYLTAAEAYARLGAGSEDSARFYLDAIRKRADPTALPSSATGAALLDSICKERRKELSFEGFRMFDLLRWKKEVIRRNGSSVEQTLPYPSNKAIAPIPLLDVRVSGLQQNPGY